MSWTYLENDTSVRAFERQLDTNWIIFDYTKEVTLHRFKFVDD